MATTKHTPGEWGASGVMVVTPPPEEGLRRIRAGEMPFVSRRIAVCEPSPYVPESQCRANAELIVRAVNAHEALLAACKEAALWSVHDFRCGIRRYEGCDCHMGRIEAAIAKAGG